jgi:hypothetical protein
MPDSNLMVSTANLVYTVAIIERDAAVGWFGPPDFGWDVDHQRSG